MADGSLPKGRIVEDVRTYSPIGDESDAESVVGGFPCQVGASMQSISSLVLDQFFRTVQGVSAAGGQDGMDDERSCLVREMFKSYDKLPRACAPESSIKISYQCKLYNQGFCSQTQK